MLLLWRYRSFCYGVALFDLWLDWVQNLIWGEIECAPLAGWQEGRVIPKFFGACDYLLTLNRSIPSFRNPTD